MTDPRHLLAEPDRFAGAACIGRWDLFDPPTEGEDRDDYLDRTEHARHLCHRCPCLPSCVEYADQLPNSHRQGSTLGAVTYGATGRLARGTR